MSKRELNIPSSSCSCQYPTQELRNRNHDSSESAKQRKHELGPVSARQLGGPVIKKEKPCACPVPGPGLNRCDSSVALACMEKTDPGSWVR